MTEDMRRRDALKALGGVGAGVAAWQITGGAWPFATAQAATCVLQPEVTEGPFWVPNHLTRRDITDGRPGIPLWLHLTTVDASTCKPIKGADVEVWHADARTQQGNAGRALYQRAFTLTRTVDTLLGLDWRRAA